jgi:nucleobase:cation symporter-1, NCS1 family
MLFDFWVLHKAKYNVLDLYQPDGIYRYNSVLINWRAVVAFIAGVAPNLPGFINSINSKIQVGVGVHPYQFGWLLGFTGTALVYCVLTILFKPRETFIDKAILPDEVYEGAYGGVVEGVEPVGEKSEYRNGDEEVHLGGNGEKKGWKSWANKML